MDPVVVQSAIKIGNYVIPGVHHFDHLMIDIIHILDDVDNWMSGRSSEQGYLDQFGKFMNEREAVQVAINAGQIPIDFNLQSKLSHFLWNQLDDTKIVCAALRYDTYIFTAPRHYHPVHHAWFQTLPEHGYWGKYPKGNVEQGFVDQHGVYHSREEALSIAIRANQINKRRPKTHPLSKLFSEDLY